MAWEDLTKEEKKKLTEADVCRISITPRIINAGWDSTTQIREQVYFTKGPIQVRGDKTKRGNPKNYEGTITWLKSGELNDCQELKGSSERITKEAIGAGSFRKNQIGDVLVAMYGATIGKTAIGEGGESLIQIKLFADAHHLKGF